MDGSFFERPILNSLSAYPARHWQADADGQPTDRIIESCSQGAAKAALVSQKEVGVPRI